MCEKKSTNSGGQKYKGCKRKSPRKKKMAEENKYVVKGYTYTKALCLVMFIH